MPISRQYDDEPRIRIAMAASRGDGSESHSEIFQVGDLSIEQMAQEIDPYFANIAAIGMTVLGPAETNGPRRGEYGWTGRMARLSGQPFSSPPAAVRGRWCARSTGYSTPHATRSAQRTGG